MTQRSSETHDDRLEGVLDRRRFLKRSGALALSVSAGSALISACGGGSSSKTTATTASGPPQRGGTLQFARAQSAETLNPILAADNGSIWVMPQLYDQLVEVRYGFEDPQPGLAESWHRSSDGLVWTFNLRQAHFSNGDPVTAEDVKFSIDRFANPKINSNYALLGSSIKDTKVLSPRQIQITLKHVDGSFLFNLAMFVPSIVPKNIVQRVGDKAFGSNPIGSGPFKLKSWRRGVSLELVRNPHYWRSGTPHLDGVTFQDVADDNTRLLNLQSGASDLASDVPYSQIARINGLSGMSVLVEQISDWSCIALNNAKPPLNDRNVRQALNYATPRQEILKSVLFGHAMLANSQVGRVKWWDPSVPPYPYDMGKAKALMAKSSARKGFTLPLIVVSGSAVESAISSIIKSQWAKLGINVVINSVDIGTALSKWYSGTATAMQFPGNVLSSDTLSSDENTEIFLDYSAGFKSFFTNYKSAEATRLVNQIIATLDSGKRTQLFAQIQRLGMTDTPSVAMFFNPARTGVNQKVQNFHTVPTGWWNLDQVWLKS